MELKFQWNLASRSEFEADNMKKQRSIEGFSDSPS